jgi:hypothetical protein
MLRILPLLSGCWRTFGPTETGVSEQLYLRNYNMKYRTFTRRSFELEAVRKVTDFVDRHELMTAVFLSGLGCKNQTRLARKRFKERAMINQFCLFLA